MLLLKERQSKQIFSLNIDTGRFQVGYSKGKLISKLLEIHFKLKDIMQTMVDYELGENKFLRITKIHYITIVSNKYLTGTCNYEILES